MYGHSSILDFEGSSIRSFPSSESSSASFPGPQRKTHRRHLHFSPVAVATKSTNCSINKQSMVFRYNTHPSTPPRALHRLGQEGKVGGADSRGGEHGVAGAVDAGDGERARHVPVHVSEAVEKVVGEGQGERALERELGGQGPGGKAGRERGRLEVHAGQRRGGVQDAEDVDSAGERHAGEAREARHDHRQLRLVDGEMRRDRAQLALRDQQLVRIGRRGLVGRLGRGGVVRGAVHASVAVAGGEAARVGAYRRGTRRAEAATGRLVTVQASSAPDRGWRGWRRRLTLCGGAERGSRERHCGAVGGGVFGFFGRRWWLIGIEGAEAS